MTEFKAKRNPLRRPTSPAELLAEDILPAVGQSKAMIAQMLGISRQSLYDLLKGKQGVTPQMALRLGKLFGNGPQLWLNMQTAHDLWEAQQALDVSTIPTLEIA